ncbi:MAG: polymer-forming cytoskeletal protein [Terracidiphilus sp.]|jgi:cytoskeletal protein CcmA (bactofilin family)
MWKSRASESSSTSSIQEPEHLGPAILAHESAARIAAQASYQAMIGKGLRVKGKITGSESLFIDGSIEGSIDLPGSRVTVGPNGEVAATIAAGDIVVLGKVCGNIVASNRVEIRAQGLLTGDVTAARLCIEEGAVLRGRIDIHGTDTESNAPEEPAKNAAQSPTALRLVQSETGNLLQHPLAQSA